MASRKRYFNEIDGFCSQWIRNAFGGEVEERSINDIRQPTSARRQHFFAGLGGWEYALRLAGWPEDREVWTGSCPCQPFSVAGKRKGVDDERHLWPAFLRLIAIGRPATIFGEQVASKDGRLWLAGVRADLEALGYAVGAADLCAASVGAPHIRQRLYWVAVANREGQGRFRGELPANGNASSGNDVDGSSENGGLGESTAQGPQRLRTQGTHTATVQGTSGSAGGAGGLADTDNAATPRPREHSGTGLSISEPESHWKASRSIYCCDGKWRRIPLEPGFQPLADDGRFGNPRINKNVSSRIGALKGAGNAIVIPLAAEFIKAVMDVIS